MDDGEMCVEAIAIAMNLNWPEINCIQSLDGMI